MSDYHISFMEKSNIQESANVLSIAMLNAQLHIAVLQGNSENERQEIEKMFCELLVQLPGIVFLAKENKNIIGVMKNSDSKLFQSPKYSMSKIATC